jgi:hypothetical protein
MLGPIVFGSLIDNICIQWDKDVACTGSGACRIYDNDNFRWKLIGYQTLFRLFACLFIIAAFIIAKVNKVFDVKVNDKVEGVTALEMDAVNEDPDGNNTDMVAIVKK